MKRKKEIMDGEGINRALSRITHEILETNRGAKDLAIIGIRTGGVYLAERLKKKIEEIEGIRIPLGIIDITLYRDDLSMVDQKPIVKKTSITFPLEDKKVILVDDVIFTGRTARAAIDALIDIGRPKIVQLAVLVDRGHRELPIMPNFVGMVVPTFLKENVNVSLTELNVIDCVHIEELS
ncbi:MAG: bifunctional pyr operon transcriptional regulator/uracil phosphoribosyltransferase PyrR [Thermodesulfobacteriota bacterium]|nr:bifunctional pyr operon transcriptional regulator/uracil phosphoribosyltransferase PyrR [Thermodesulfobacteriota bacterium]